MQKTVFITGVAGFLGSHLADKFLAEGYAVKGCDNLIGGYKDNVPAGVEFFELDLNEYEKVAEVVKGSDIVYHCAASPHEGLSVFSPYTISLNGFNASSSIISAAIANRVKRFVYCSSMARYGFQEKLPFTEDMIPRPQDPYGVGKLAGEEVLRMLAEEHGMEYVIAVPHNIIGPRQKYDDPFRNVVSIMANRMLQGKQPIIYGDGEQKRCFSYVADDVDPLFMLATAAVSGEVFNIGPDQEFVTINELALKLADILSFKLEPIYMPDRPREVKLANCSADKARTMLGYNPTRSLEEGLHATVDYIKKRGSKPFDYYLNVEIINDKTPATWKNKTM